MPITSAVELASFAIAVDDALAHAARVIAHLAALRDDAQRANSPPRALAAIDERARQWGVTQ
jgi:hypothetical protein